MVFSGLIFLYAFFPLCMLAYALCRTLRARNAVLLVFSLFFYAWGEPKYLLLLASMAFFDWFAALRIARAESRGGKKAWLAAACTVNLLLIGFFKYSGMIAPLFGEPPAFIRNISLPIGISFYTFQLLSYVVDVYRGDAEPQERYRNVLLYAALFHQCIAGPIVRYKTIAGELFSERDPLSGTDLADGIGRFCVGLAKKTLLANACGALASSLLLSDAAIADKSLLAANLAALQGSSVLGLWLGSIAFSLQIYLDFSAYSDMAVGMGRMIGLHFPENFNYPYVSRSAAEFWRRWHITLGTFFRDYVYIPLGGNRCPTARGIFNIFVVWALTGLWHGASWSFVVWGLYYFALLLLEKFVLNRLFRRLRVLPHLYLLFAVNLGWVLFHLTDFSLARAAIGGMFGAYGNPLTDFRAVTLLKNNVFLLLFCALACTPLFRDLFRRLRARCAAGGISETLFFALEHVAAPAALLLLSTAALVGNTYNPFLYFQF